MIVRNSNSPRDLSRQQAREEGASSTGAPSNLHKVARHDRLITAQLSNNFRHDLPDQPGVIALVGVNGAVEAFQFIDFRSFHGAASTEGAKPDHVAR